MSPPFDPSAPARPGSGVFGLDHDADSAGLHLLPVPFDATASYRRGAADGPEAIRAASHQVDLYDIETGRPYEHGIWMAPSPSRVVEWNLEARACADRVLAAGELAPGRTDEQLAADVARVNQLQGELNDWLYQEVTQALDADKRVGVVGGDHSVPFSAIRAHAERFPGMGLLHIDAHADLRDAYEGFTWSHASILHNVLKHVDTIRDVVQVGIRDLCEEEHDAMRGSDGRVRALFDYQWAETRQSGDNLVALVRRTIASLPRRVYVTFDIDGLDPALCPNTGTPVPGGLSWNEGLLWLRELVRSGRRIVGFDLTEVAPGDRTTHGEGRDEIVGARLLYKLIGFSWMSRVAPR